MASKTFLELNNKISSLIQQRPTKKRDLRGIFADAQAMHSLVKYMARSYRGKIDYILSPDTQGLVFASMLAMELEVGLLPIKNRPCEHTDEDNPLRAAFINHRNQARVLLCRKGLIPKDSRVLLADDWVETAATMTACQEIAEQLGVSVTGIASIGANRNEFTKKWLDEGKLNSLILQ